MDDGPSVFVGVADGRCVPSRVWVGAGDSSPELHAAAAMAMRSETATAETARMVRLDMEGGYREPAEPNKPLR